MKSKTERPYNTELRLQHFREAVDRQFRKSRRLLSLKQVCALVATQPAPQFYITPKQALEKYNLYKQGKDIKADNPRIRQMYMDLFERYEEARAKLGGGFKYMIMQDVIDSPAPSFYFSPTSAADYYYRAMEEKRKNNRNKRK